MDKLKQTIFHDRTERFCRKNKDGSFSFILRCHKDYKLNIFMNVFSVETPLKYQYTRGDFAYYKVSMKIDKPVIRYC